MYGILYTTYGTYVTEFGKTSLLRGAGEIELAPRVACHIKKPRAILAGAGGLLCWPDAKNYIA
jgi:hypothetical protein